MDLIEARKRLPALADLDDTSFVEAVQELYYPDTPVSTLAAELGVKAAPVPTPDATFGDRIKDTGVSLMKGGVGAVQGVVGIADLATQGAAGKAVEDAGIDLKGAQQYWGDKYSPAQKAAFDKFEQADGVVDKTVAAVTNPSIIAQTAVESLPAMAVGGLIGRGAMAVAPRIGGAVAAGAGEGAIMAGSQAETIRGETADGRLTGEQVGLSALTGVAGGAIGVFGAKLAKSFGLADVDALMAGVATSPIAAKSVTRQVLQGAVTEGFLEELPQSVVEQVLQNKALGKQLDEGVDTAAVLGTLTGGAMGGAVNFGSGITRPRATAEDVLAAPDVDSAIAAAQAAVKSPVVVAPVDPVASTPDAEPDPFSAPIPTALPASVAAPIAETAPAASITGTDPATLMQRPNPLMEAATGEDQRQEELAAQAMDRMSRDAADDGQALREFPASTLPRKMPKPTALPEVDEAIQPNDILQKNGALWPEKGARLKAKSVGGTVVAVNGGFLVRPAVKETALNVEQAAPVAPLVKAAEPQPKAADAPPQATAPTAPVPAPAVDTAPAQVQPDAGGAAVAVGGQEQRDGSLTTIGGLTIEVAGQLYPVESLKQASNMAFQARKQWERQGSNGRIGWPKIRDGSGSVIGYVGPGEAVYAEENAPPGSPKLYDPIPDVMAQQRDDDRTVQAEPSQAKLPAPPNVKNQPSRAPAAPEAQSPQAPAPEGSNAPGATATATQPGADALEADGVAKKRGGDAAPSRDAKTIARETAKARPDDDVAQVREAARKAIVDELGQKALDDMGQGNFMTGDELTQMVHEGQYEAVRDFAAAMPVPVHESDIPMETAVRAYSGTSHSPERRGSSAQRGYVIAMADAWKRATRAAGNDPEALARVTDAMQSLVSGYRQRYLSALASHSRVMSTNITGAGNFPVRSNQKKSEAADKRANEASDFLKMGLARMLKAAKAPTDNSPGSELARAQSNLDERERRQTMMKAVNAALRKGDDKALADMGLSEARITELKKPDFAGRKGFPDYALTNNNAEIRRLRERLASAEKRIEQAEAGPVEREYAGARIEENAQDDRLRLFFDGKPDEAVRTDLKANGFRWSPNAGAWQRQLTDNARAAAKRVLDKHFGADAPSLKRSDPRSGMPPGNLRDALNDSLARLSIPYQIHDSVEDARLATKLDIPSGAKGMHFRGKIHLFAGSIGNSLEGEFVLWHEANHAGLYEVYGRGQEYEQALRAIAAQNKQVRERAARWMDKYGQADYQDRLDAAEDAGKDPEDKAVQARAMLRTKLQAIDEALSDMAGETANISGLKRFIAKVQEVMRSLGLNELADWIEQQSDATALAMILNARNAVTGKVKPAKQGEMQPAFSENDAASLSQERGTTEPMASRKDVVGNEDGGRSADDYTPALRTYADVRDAVSSAAKSMGLKVFTKDDSKVSDSAYLYLDDPAKPSRIGGGIKVRLAGHTTPESGAIYGPDDISVVGSPGQRMVDEAISELVQHVGRAVPSDVAQRISERNEAARQAMSEGEASRTRNALDNGPAEIERLEREASEWQAKADALPDNAKKRNAVFKAKEAREGADYWRKEIDRASKDATKVSAAGANSNPGESTGANSGGADRSIANESPAPNSDGASFSREPRTIQVDGPSDDRVQFSRSSTAPEYLKAAHSRLNEAFAAPGKLSWWHRSFGTMYNLAERSPQFKPVFEAAQGFINDVSLYASQAADLAPRILPKLEHWRDITKSPISAEDNKAVEAPINQGTLEWTRDAKGKPVKVSQVEAEAAKMTPADKAQAMIKARRLDPKVLRMWQGMQVDLYENIVNAKYEREMLRAGIVWTPAELKSQFNLTPSQIALYQEFRKAVDMSLDNMAKAEMLRHGGQDVAGLRQAVMDEPDLETASLMLSDYLRGLGEQDQERADVLGKIAEGMAERAEKVMQLKAEGYAPLSRFGQYTVDVVVDGERQYFGLYESTREANKAAMAMRQEFGAQNVAQGTLSQQEFKLFAGITPESLEIFGNMLGLDSTGDEARDKAFQEYLQRTKSNRSAMKRLIHRKGIAGFSQDVGRVLASFVYSNARQTSAALHMGDLAQAITDIPKTQGELKDAAIGLSDYIKNPQEEAAAIRALLFAQFLGGSIASAFVNMTQPFAVTFPWLSQYGGAAQSAAQLKRAFADLSNKSRVLEPDLVKAMDKYEAVLEPQEIHHLQAQARGAATLKPGDGTQMGDAMAKGSNALSKLSLAWGKVFGMAEQINRKSTFIAAYRVAKAQKMADPGAFAKRAVDETQFVYSKANKMRFGRGAVGGTLMTFKTYSVAYVELLTRMYSQGGREGKQATLLALAVLFLMGGAGGLPFAEDVEDLIDGALQRLGYNVSSKTAKREFLEGLFGRAGAEFVERGISGIPGVPIDVSGRLGLGNLIPGTGLFQKKDNYSRDIAELAGPAGDFAKRLWGAKDHVLAGDLGKAALQVSPVAVRNAAKGADMADTGMYRDDKGYKVLDTTMLEAAMKSIGFQPATVAQVQESNWINQRSKAFYSQTAADIRSRWAKGIFEKDPEQIAEARAMLARWNENNPDQRMSANLGAIMKRVKEMSKSKDQRIADTAPKAMRANMQREAAELRGSLQ